ncbi:MAG: glycosyltransferase family 39 protein [Deltaproteobacteria bacterium]|nr:glycosyltransferase family 39 protein [Deltaproteobacteria bacterium]
MTSRLARVVVWVRERRGLLALLGLALGLRLPLLGAVPNPTGDEGNWAWYAHSILRGRPVTLPPDARFVSLAFARLLTLAYRLLGVSYGSARLVPVVAVLLAMVFAWRSLRRAGHPDAALAVAALVAVHPWSVLWSRTVTVPYALAFGLALAGPLAVYALVTRRERPWGLVPALQLCALGLHFTPLAALPALATGLWVLASSERRRAVAHPALAVGLLLALAHPLWLARGALGAAQAFSRPPLGAYFTLLPARLEVFARALLGGLGGEATVRHFTGEVLPWPAECALLAAVALALAAALRVGTLLARFAALQLAVATVGLPLLLAPARTWNLPGVDAERYVFAVLAPAVLLLGALAERPRGRSLVALVALVASVQTARVALGLLGGCGPDRGAFTLAGGGGYRGWKVPRERRAVAALVREEALRQARGEPVTVLVADHAFHPLHMLNADGGPPTVDVAKFPLPRAPGRLHLFVLWSPGVFAPGYLPAEDLAHQRSLEALLHGPRFTQPRAVRALTQADGAPLVTLWTARARE